MANRFSVRRIPAGTEGESIKKIENSLQSAKLIQLLSRVLFPHTPDMDHESARKNN